MGSDQGFLKVPVSFVVSREGVRQALRLALLHSLSRPRAAMSDNPLPVGWVDVQAVWDPILIKYTSKSLIWVGGS